MAITPPRPLPDASHVVLAYLLPTRGLCLPRIVHPKCPSSNLNVHYAVVSRAPWYAEIDSSEYISGHLYDLPSPTLASNDRSTRGREPTSTHTSSLVRPKHPSHHASRCTCTQYAYRVQRVRCRLALSSLSASEPPVNRRARFARMPTRRAPHIRTAATSTPLHDASTGR